MIFGPILSSFGANRIISLFNRRSLATGALISLISATMVVAAVRANGSAATSVRLDDGTVWVTNQQTQRVGRLNIRIRELDMSISAADSADVIQDGRSVFFSAGGGGVQRIDVISGRPSGSNEIPISNYQVRSGVGLVLDRESGNLWVGRDGTIIAPEYPKLADGAVDPGSLAVVAEAVAGQLDEFGRERGAVLIAGPSGWFDLALDEGLKPTRPPEPDPSDGPASEASSTTTTTTSGVEPTDTKPPAIADPVMHALPVDFSQVAAMSAVGSEPIFLLVDGRVATAGAAPVTLPGSGAVLQQPGARSDVALAATSAGLFQVKLSDGAVTQLSSADAAPAAPVRVGPCVYGAWSGAAPTSFKSCNGTVLRDQVPITNASPGANLIFRVNQRNVALNSPGDGGVWADHEGSLAYVGNWADVEQLSLDTNISDQSLGESRRTVEKSCAEGGSNPPTAGDDQLGVRPHQSIIDVLYNDDDVNCEPIAINAVDPVSGDWGQLTIIDNGQHLLYSPSDSIAAAAASTIQSFKFSYTVGDSSGHTSTPASVTVIVKDRSLGNAAPELRPKKDGTTRKMRTVVEEGRSISYDIMSDWWDPDGDNIILVGAQPEGTGQVSATPAGIVRYSANGVSPGIEHVLVTLTDGVLTGTESLEVTVKPTGSEIPPVTSNDFMTVVVGSTGIIDPLANDSDPNADRLNIRPLWLPEDPGTFRTEMTGSQVKITGLAAGIYALEYEATDGVVATRGTIRLTVVAPDDINHGPVAVPDQMTLRADRVVNVDVLANDIDFDGDILSVIGVTVGGSDPSAGVVRASIIDRRLVQLEVVPGPGGEAPTGPFVVNYKIDDGRAPERALTQTMDENIADALRATGAITVLIQPATEDQPPILAGDTALVRSGSVVAAHVLRNDIDPDSDPLVLESVDADQAAALEDSGDGVAWIEGRDVYFQGGAPGRYSILYTVSAGGKTSTAEVSFEVTPLPDPETHPNQAPSPPDLILRAIRNSEVRLNIARFGSDPDGDPVKLVDEFSGLSGAAQGNRVAIDPDNPNALVFEAGPTSGPSDQFTYVVRDRFGARGTATVQVMIVDDLGWSPQAHDDVFRGAPGRTLTIPVLANDSSPQDRRLSLEELTFFDSDGQPSESPSNTGSVRLLDQTDKSRRGLIEVVVPTDGSTIVEHYRITDGRNSGDAFIRVTADPDAPNIAPVANADVVDESQIAGVEQVNVDVLVNDFDPDDASAVLTVSIPGGQPATAIGGIVTVPLTEQPHTVLYRITDAAGATAIGQIDVPGLQNHPPTLSSDGQNPGLRVIEAGSDTTLPIALAGIVVDPDGDTNIQLTSTEVVVLGGIGEVRRAADNKSFIYTPPPLLEGSADVSIQFEVTDRPEKSNDERQSTYCNCLATLTVGLTITGSSPPYVLTQGAVPLPQLDEPVDFDLSGIVADDQNDPLEFTIDDSTRGGIDGQLNGSVVTFVSQRGGADMIPVGTQIPVRFTVSDGVFDPIDGTVMITMIATNKGQPAAGSFPVFQAERDQQFAIPSLINAASNPFPQYPLTLLEPNVDGGASVVCAADGSCTFLSNTVGTFNITYTLKDAVDQVAAGSLEVVVKGLPLAPGVPSIESVGDHVVNLTWAAADMQGGAFVTYTVTAVEAGITMPYTSTGGQFGGLPNGVAQHFTVVAENELGLGEVTAPSSPAVPDRVPDPPVGATITDYADGALTLQWSPPPTAGEFTAIKQYEVSIGGQIIVTDGATTSLVIGTGGMGTPLNNGTPYSFTVRAQNSANTDNGWGQSGVASLSETPSRFPDPPTGVLATSVGDGGTPRLTVTWNKPAFDGGRPIDSYQICLVQAPGNCQTITSGLQATFALPRNQASSFTAIAFSSDKNKNDSVPSAPSGVVTTVGTPDTPVLGTVTWINTTASVTATSANNSGCSSYTIHYSIDDGATWANVTGSFAGLTNGIRYGIAAKAVLAASCGTPGTIYESVPSSPATGTPYGPLAQPSIRSSRSATTVTWSWSTNRGNDGRRAWSAALAGPCSAVAVGAGTYSRDFGFGPATFTCTISVSAGGQTLQASSSQTTPPPPPPPPTVSVGIGPLSPGQCPLAVGGDPGCYYASIGVSNWVGTHTVHCFGRTPASTWAEYASFSFSANGTYNNCLYSLAGRVIKVTVDGTIQGQSSNSPPNTVSVGAVSNQSAQWPAY